jgi:hypothetical protein
MGTAQQWWSSGNMGGDMTSRQVIYTLMRLRLRLNLDGFQGIHLNDLSKIEYIS